MLPRGAFPFLRKTLQAAMGSSGHQERLLRGLCLQILLFSGAMIQAQRGGLIQGFRV